MNKVTVYSTTICPYCDAAKRYFKESAIPFEDINLDRDHELRMKLSSENGGWRTVPMIFIGDHFVGGFTELIDVVKKGQLSSLLGIDGE